MSKRDLKKYLAGLTQEQTAEQLLALYEKFSEVKTYYDFVFNPNEEKLLREAKLKITNEYFPIKSKRAKLRRSVAQKYIKHFLLLGVDPFAVADLMLHNIQVAQRYSAKRDMKFNSFFKSMLNSYEQAAKFVIEFGITAEFRNRFDEIAAEAARQKWDNYPEMEFILENLSL